MKKLLLLTLTLVCILPIFAQSVRLSKGTTIAVTFVENIISNTQYPTANVVVSGDVYDDSGNYIIIQQNTPVMVQLNVRKGKIWGDVGKIEVTPISTQAVNGRQIAFVAEPVVFKGNESFVSAGMQAKISEGTSFIATIANNYVFNIE